MSSRIVGNSPTRSFLLGVYMWLKKMQMGRLQPLLVWRQGIVEAEVRVIRVGTQRSLVPDRRRLR